jgi:hypothetical protein
MRSGINECSWFFDIVRLGGACTSGCLPTDTSPFKRWSDEKKRSEDDMVK